MVSNELRKIAENMTKEAVSWTKGHFQAVADIIEKVEATKTVKSALALMFVSYFEASNKSFRPEQFIRACGLPVSILKDKGEAVEE